MNAQVIRPILNVPSDNLFGNTTDFSDNNDHIGYSFAIDNTVTKDNCYSLKSIDDYLKTSFWSLYTVASSKAYFSFYIKSSAYANDINIEVIFSHSLDTYSIPKPTVLNQWVRVGIEVNGSYYEMMTEAYEGIESCRIAISNSATVWITQPKLEYGTSPTPYCPSIYDNVEWDYSQYGATTFQTAKSGDILNITEYQYKKSLTDVGLFSMTIPLDTPYADEIAEDYYLFVDKKDWLLVQDVKKTETGYAITGTDLKGILATRITLYDVVNDTMGFDSVSGSTEECCKHYVLNNVINPIDSNRIIPLVTLAYNQNRGIVDDTYMSRFEYLHEVIKKLCENAEIGYTMYADVMNNKIIFDIVNIVDKTIDQQIRNRVVFDVKNKNVLSYERVKGNSTYKNAFYATKSGGGLETDATTKLCCPAAEAPTGIARKEMHLNVSCDSVADIETYAKYQYKDYAKIDSLKIAPADVNGYGTVFDVGDMVTQKIDDEYVNTVIQSAEETYSGGNYNVTINFGDEQPQPLKYLKTMINNKGV